MGVLKIYDGATWQNIGGNSIFDSTALSQASGGWNSTQSTVNSNSAIWSNVWSQVNSLSDGWTLSGTEVDLGDIPTLSADWNSTYTTVNSNSADWSAGSDVSTLSANWEGTYTTVNSNSADWDINYWNRTGTVLSPLSAGDEIHISNALSAYSTKLIKSDTTNLFTLKDNVNSVAGAGNAIDFEASSSQYATLNSVINFAGDLTIAAWIKRESLDAYANIFSSGDGSVGWIFLLWTDNKLGFYTGTWKYSTSTIADTNWHHVAIKLSGTTYTFYIDSVPAGTGTISQPITTTYKAVIGSQYITSPANYFDGLIDELNVWDRALSDAEMITLYNSGNGLYGNLSITPFNTNFKIGYHFDEVAGTNIADFGTTNNYATTVNNPAFVDGHVLIEGGIKEINVLQSRDGKTESEYGTVELGDNNVRTTLNGKTLRFNIDSAEIAQISANGEWDFKTHLLHNVVNPILAQDVATKNYVDINRFDSSLIQSSSGSWNSTYTTVNSNSATTWNYQGTDLKDLSGNWQSTYTNVNANSADWSAGSDVSTLSANWESTYLTVQSNSATTWNYQGTDLKDLSGNWQSTYTNVNTNSADWANHFDSSEIVAASANWNSVYSNVNVNSAEWNEAFKDVLILGGTGLINGGRISVNGTDNTKFDVASGSGWYIDNTSNPGYSNHINVTWPTLTGQTPAYLATHYRSSVMITSDGNVVQMSDFPTLDQARDYIILGRLLHDSLSSLNGAISIPRVVYNTALDADDLALSLGSFNIEGNVFNPNGANLYLNKSSGSTFRIGANYNNNPKNPNTTTEGPLSAFNFKYRYRNGVGGFTYGALTSSINPNIYDDGTGIFGSVDANKFTIQRVYLFAGTTNIYVTPGQAQYTNLTDAKIGITTESPIIDPLFKEATLRSYIAVKQGVSALNDPLFAYFGAGGKLGEPLAGGSTGGDVVGPVSSTDNGFVYFNGSTGKTIHGGSYGESDGNNWQSTFTTVNTNSGNWNYQGTDLKDLSGNWQSSYEQVNSLSSDWANHFDPTDIIAASGSWNSVYSNVNTNSGNWNYQGTDLKDLSGNWQSTYTTVNTNSADWSAGSDVSTISANWESTYTTVNANSAGWELAETTVNSTSARWESNWTTVNSNSADWGGTVIDPISSSNWNSTFQTVCSLSATWGTGGDVSNFELELTRKTTGNSYMEFTTVAGNVTGVDYWTASNKVTPLFTKVITYSGSNPTLIVLTDATNAKILTTTIVYNISGDVTSVTKVVS